MVKSSALDVVRLAISCGLPIKSGGSVGGAKAVLCVKVGTIFHDSPLGLDKWMVAMCMLVNCRNGVSSYEIARTIGITQKSAWHM
jgi:hypothetical protein